MKKIFTLLTLCLCMSATAWADITESWTTTAPPHSRPIITTYPKGLTYSGDNKVHAVTQVIKVEPQDDVTFTLTITDGTLNVLGVDLAKADGTVQASDYTAKELTTSAATYTATLSAVPAGYYVLRYFVHNNATDNADLDNTTGSLNVTGAVQAPVITDLADLSNDKLYLVKSGRTTATKDIFLLYNSGQNGYLSSNFAEESKNTSLYDGLDKFQFAIYKHTDNKYYFYSPKAKCFIGNETADKTAIPIVGMASNAVEIRTTSTVSDYPFMLSTNGSYALYVADTGDQHGVINWTDGYSQTGDHGNAFVFIEVGDLDTDKKSLIQNKITYGPDYWAAQNLFTNSNNLGSSYVGNYKDVDWSNLFTALTTLSLSTTEANYNTMMTEYNNVINNASKVTLNNGEIFQIKCTTAERGYLAFYNTKVNNESGQTTFDGTTTLTLAGVTAASGFPNVGAENVSTDWAMYKYNDKCYLYNTENKKFIKSGNPLTFTENATQASPVTLESIDGTVAGWRLKFVGTSQYISFSHSYGLNEGARQYDAASDAGVQHYLIKTGSSVRDADAGPIAYKILSPDIESNLATVKAYRAKTDVSKVGHYTYSGDIDVATAINTAEALIASSAASSTASEVETSLANLKAIPAGYTINQPTAGKLYRLKGKVNTKYVTGNLATDNDIQKMALSTENGVETVFMFRDAGNGKFKLLNVGNGFYINNTWAIGSSNSEFDQFTFEASPTNLGYYVPKTDKSSCYMYNDTEQDVVDGQDSYAANVCDWEIEEVDELPVPIYNDAYKLGTFYSPKPLIQNTDLIKFYTGTVTNNYFNLTQYTGDVIPAETAFVTEYVGGQVNNCAYLAIADSDPGIPDNNQLAGQIETITTPTITGKTICTMQEISSALTFASYTGTTVKGFRAYLPVDNNTAAGGDSSFRLVFGVPTGIDTIDNQPAQEQTVYDLSGRRVEHAGKGLYIVNGKKVMIK